MGHKDLNKLHRIYRYIQQLNKEKNWNFIFRVDNGSYETRIDCHESGHVVLGNGQLPLIGYEMNCPDLLDWNHGIIIEFEEEARSNTGFMKAKKHKGHTEYTNTKDTKRDSHYKKFILLKIWESDIKSSLWKRKIISCLNLYYSHPISPLY